jgi:hypothetical protein
MTLGCIGHVAKVGGHKEFITIWGRVRKPLEKFLPLRPRRRWQDKFKMVLEILVARMWGGWKWLRIMSNGFGISVRKITFIVCAKRRKILLPFPGSQVFRGFPHPFQWNAGSFLRYALTCLFHFTRHGHPFISFFKKLIQCRWMTLWTNLYR